MGAHTEVLMQDLSPSGLPEILPVTWLLLASVALENIRLRHKRKLPVIWEVQTGLSHSKDVFSTVEALSFGFPATHFGVHP